VIVVVALIVIGVEATPLNWKLTVESDWPSSA